MQLAAQPAPLLLDRGDGLAAGLDEVLGRAPGRAGSGPAAGRSAAAPARRRARSDRSPGRSPTTSSPAPSRSRVRVCVVSVPELASGRAVDQQRGVRDDQRLADRPQRDAPGPRRSGRPPADAAPSGSGRSPNSSWSTTPRSTHRRSGGTPSRTAPRPAASAPVLRSSAPRASSRAEREHEQRHHGDEGGTVHDRPDHQAADVDEVGQRGADVHRRADQGEHRGRQRRHGVAGDVLGGEGGEEVDEPGQDEGQRHPHQRAPLAVRGDLDPPPRVDQERAALHQPHQPGHPRVGVGDRDDAAADDDDQADEVDGVPPAEPRDRWRARPGRARDTASTAVSVPASSWPEDSSTAAGTAGAPGEHEQGRRDERPPPQQQRHARRAGGHRDDREGQVEGVHGLSRPGRARGPGSPPRSGRLTSSLAKIVVRLLLTVFGERCRVDAISAVRRPCGEQLEDLRLPRGQLGERVVGAGGPAGSRSARASGRRSPAPKIAWPRTTARIASAISSCSAPLSR